MSKSKNNNPPARQQVPRNLPQQQIIERRHEYHGLIPPPVILQQFDELIPGTASRLIQWAEDEQRHRQNLEREAQDANISAQRRHLEIAGEQTRAVARSDVLGQSLGFAVCLMCIGGAVWLALSGQPWVAGVLAGIPTAAVIQAFRSGVFASKRSDPPKR